LLAHGRWFSLGTPASSTTKTGRHDIAEILLKVALNTKNQSINQSINQYYKGSFGYTNVANYSMMKYEKLFHHELNLYKGYLLTWINIHQ
jgi:hypothetical protein